MSDCVRPHRWQPTRLPRPWDSLGKNTGVGCHFLLQCMQGKSQSQSCPTLRDRPLDCSLPGSSIHGIFLARVLEWVANVFSLLKPTVTNFKSTKFVWPSVRPVGVPATTKQHERHRDKSGSQGGEGTASPLRTRSLRVRCRLLFSLRRPQRLF